MSRAPTVLYCTVAATAVLTRQGSLGCVWTVGVVVAVLVVNKHVEVAWMLEIGALSMLTMAMRVVVTLRRRPLRRCHLLILHHVCRMCVAFVCCLRGGGGDMAPLSCPVVVYLS